VRVILLLTRTLTWPIGYLTATASDDWTLFLELCERASSSENMAKEAARALKQELKCVRALNIDC